MKQVVHDDKLLIHFFQDNYNDITLSFWYIWLNNTKIKGWKDFVGTFI